MFFYFFRWLQSIWCFTTSLGSMASQSFQQDTERPHRDHKTSVRPNVKKQIDAQEEWKTSPTWRISSLEIRQRAELLWRWCLDGCLMFFAKFPLNNCISEMFFWGFETSVSLVPEMFRWDGKLVGWTFFEPFQRGDAFPWPMGLSCWLWGVGSDLLNFFCRERQVRRGEILIKGNWTCFFKQCHL